MTYDFFEEHWDKNFDRADFRNIDNIFNTNMKLKLSALNTTTKKNKTWAFNNKYNHYLEGISPKLKDNRKSLKSLIKDKEDKLVIISFRLKKPLLTTGEENLYIHENPICKEKVFKIPMIRASSIKGKMRWVASKHFLENTDKLSDLKDIFEERAKLVRLFGGEKDNMAQWLNKHISETDFVEIEDPNEIGDKFKKYLEKNGYYRDNIENRQGRLHFYPIFFDDIALEVITPIDRDTGTATQPIHIEKFPIGTRGEIRLLYYPFDILGNEEKIEKQKEEDSEIISEALYDMLTNYGIGAKTSDGYGVAERDSIPNKEEIKGLILDE